MRQMVLADDDLDIHTETSGGPSTSITRPSPAVRGREVGDLDIDRQPLHPVARGKLRYPPATALLRLRLFAQHPMWRLAGRRDNLRAFRYQDRSAARRACHALVNRCDIVRARNRRGTERRAQSAIVPRPALFIRLTTASTRIVENPHDRRIAARQHPRDPPAAPPVSTPRSFSTRTSSPCIAPFSSFGGINRSSSRDWPSLRPHKTIAVAMQIELLQPAGPASPSARLYSRYPIHAQFGACPERSQRVRDEASLTRAVFSGAALGSAHCSASIFTISPRAVIRASCSSSSRRSRPPPSPSSRTSCLYPRAGPPSARCASRSSRSVRGYGVFAIRCGIIARVPNSPLHPTMSTSCSSCHCRMAPSASPLPAPASCLQGPA